MRALIPLTGAIALAMSAWTIPADAGKSDDTLNVAFGADFENIDPYLGATREGITMAHHVFDGLLFRDPDDFEYKPNLAKSYEWVDTVTIDFELRQGVRFHNGEKFDADDVVFTLNYVTKPDSGNRSPHLVEWIKSAEKLGEYKVRVHLKRAFGAALDYFGLPVRIYPNEYFNEVGPEGFIRKPVGTGPYKVAEIVPGKSVTLVKNDDLFAGSQKSGATIGTINFRVLPEMNTQIAEIISRGLDWIWRVPEDQAEKLETMPDITVVRGETLRIGAISFDVKGISGQSPMQNLQVRKAIAHAVDRQAIRDHLVKGSSRVIHAACHPAQFGCTDDVTKYEYDPEKAKKLLADAGYPDGFEIDLYSWSPRQRVEAVAGDLRKIGIRANPQILQNPAVRKKLLAHEVPFLQFNWGSDSVADTIASAGVFFRFGHYDIAQDEQVRDWLNQATGTVDVAERKAFYKKALQKISDQIYMLPISTWVTNYALSADLEFKPSLDEYPRFYRSRWR